MAIYWKKNRRNKIEWMKHENIKDCKERQFIKRQIINSRGNICSLCGKPITNMKDCTIDHIIPISKGGLTTLENCQIAHRWCNLEKGDNIES